MELTNCPECSKQVAFHLRSCSYCQADVGFPNVRIAESEPEKVALEARYKGAIELAAKNNVSEKVKDFEALVDNNSGAVICMSFANVLKTLEKNQLYTSFHNEVSSGARIAENNEFDDKRGVVDSLLFPEYAEKITFAALSFNAYGANYYGGYSVRICEDAIQSRASVFHEDSMSFIKTRNVGAVEDVPAGYRSNWKDRAKLAIAKLGGHISQDTAESEFNEILIKVPQDDKDTGDYIEAHLYGGVIREAFASVAANENTDNAEIFILKKKIKKANKDTAHIVFIE